jgi:hypothetical protein
MKQARPITVKDYSGLFLGDILLGLFVIVLSLMVAIGQSRARTSLLMERGERLGAATAVTLPADSTLTAANYSQANGTNRRALD